MKIVFFGTSSFGLPSLEVLHSKYSILAVVSTPDKPSGRHLQMHSSAVKQWALEHKITYFDYIKENPSALLLELKKLHADLFVVVSFGAILNSDFLMLPRLNCLNIHASLLPKYRGAAPMQYALLNGDRETGISIIRMIERLDAGDILLQKKMPIEKDENLKELEEQLSPLGAQAILEAIDQMERAVVEWTVQQESHVSYAKKILKNDGKINWQLSDVEIHNRIRAFFSWPGSFFLFHDKRFLVLKSERISKKIDKQPGTILDVSSSHGLEVAVGSGGCVRLTELKMEGKKALSWQEFSKGFVMKVGDILE